MERRPPLTLRRARARKWAGIDPRPAPDRAREDDEDGSGDLVEFEIVERCESTEPPRPQGTEDADADP